jgi:hypothetical protein
MSQGSGPSVDHGQVAQRGPQSERDEGVVSNEVLPLRSGETVPTIDGAPG